jgi:hypothetical protein
MKQSKKSAKRWHKKQRMAKMYREFFADPTNVAEINECGVGWAVDLHPRLVRDTVLGSRAHRSASGEHG